MGEAKMAKGPTAVAGALGRRDVWEMHEQDDVVTLVDEDGAEHDFNVIDVIEVDECEYVVLEPAGEESGEAIILKFVQDEEGNDLLVDIEDDEEWEKVADAWGELNDEDEDEDEDLDEDEDDEDFDDEDEDEE